MGKRQTGGRRVLTPVGKYLIDSGLAGKAVKAVSAFGQKKARALLGEQAADAVKGLEAGALTGLTKIRGRMAAKDMAGGSMFVPGQGGGSIYTAGQTMRGYGADKKIPTVGSRRQVFNGFAVRTSGGLTKEKLMKNPAGRIVSRAKSAFGKEKAIKFLINKGYVAEKGKFKLFRKT